MLARWLVAGSAAIDVRRAGAQDRGPPSTRRPWTERAGRQNLRGVFGSDVTEPLRLTEHTDAVILVDDVFTTGATAREVSSVLIKGTGLPVHVFTFSRAVAGTH